MLPGPVPHDPTSPAAPAPAPAAPPAHDAELEETLARLASRCRSLDAEELERLAGTVVEESRRHELPIELTLAVIHVESSFNPFAVSPAGAMGLMQLLPSTAAEVAHKLGLPWHGPQALFDPSLNVRLGTQYFRELLDRYRSVPVALAAYNWGPGRIDRRLRRGHPMPVVYPHRVLGVYERSRSRADS